MAITKIHLLPLFTSILFPATIITTYIISVCLGHVSPEFPYISDTGIMIPESCIFSQLLNIAAALMVGCMYVRYKLVEQHHRDHMSTILNRALTMNQFAFGFGILSALGLSLLSNFQVSKLFWVHMVGFFFATLGGLTYVWLQTALSFQGAPHLNSASLAWTRFFLSLFATASFIATLCTGLLAVEHKVEGSHLIMAKPGDKNFVLHVTSAGLEWIMMFSFNFFLLTLSIDFKNITFHSPKVVFLLEELNLSSSDIYQSEDRISQTQGPTTPPGPPGNLQHPNYPPVFQ